VILFLAIFAAMPGSGIIVPIIPLYAKTLGANGLWLGAIFAGFSIGRTVLMPAVGKASDRSGRKHFIAFGLMVYTVSCLGYVYAQDAAHLLTVRVIQGFSSAMVVPVAMAYIGEISPEESEGSYMGLFTVSLFLGFGFGPILGGLLMDSVGYAGDFLAMGALCCVAFLVVVFYLPESGPSRLAEEESFSYRTILKDNSMRGISCYRFSSAFSRGSVMAFLPLYANSVLHLDSLHIGAIVSSSILLTSLLQVPFGRLADRFSRKKLIVWSNLLYFAGIVLIPYTATFPQILTVNILLGIFGAFSLPAASALTVVKGRTYGMGSAMAVFNVAMSLGLGCGPILCGLVFDSLGMHAVFYFCMVQGIIGTFVFSRLFSGDD
jgi:MFS family permease